MSLTVFLLVAGAFTVFCSFKNYDWFFNSKEQGPQKAIAKLGRGLSRVAFILIGLACLGWGIYRVIEPPRDIPLTFLQDIARPVGIDLSSPEAGAQLQSSGDIQKLEVASSGDWISFETVLPTDNPHYVDARDAAVAGPDFRKGFHLNPKNVDGSKVGGRIVHYDEDYVICDNVLFSKQPLSSAHFIMVICPEDLSEEVDGLRLVFARRGTDVYKKLDD